MSAAADIEAIVKWLRKSSPDVRMSPFGDEIYVQPYAVLLPIDPDAPAGPQWDLSELGEGGAVLFVPDVQLPRAFGASRMERERQAEPGAADRLSHLFQHRMGVDLPDVMTVALTSPAQSVREALEAEDLGDIDLAAVAVLAAPPWAYTAADRFRVALLCQGVPA